MNERNFLLEALQPFETLMCRLGGFAALTGNLGNCESTIDPRSLDIVASGLLELSSNFESAHSAAWAAARGDAHQGGQTPCV